MARYVPVCVAGCLGLLLAISPAQARGDVFEVPNTCGSEAELEKALEGLVGARVEARAAVDLRREAAGYTLRVYLDDGTRELRDRDCRALFGAAVLILGLALSEHRQADLTRESTRALAVRQKATRAQAPSPPSPHSRKLHGQASMHVGAHTGLTKGISGAASLAASLRARRWGLRGHATYVLARDSHPPAREGVRVQAVGGGLALTCDVFDFLRLGAGAELMAVYGRGVGTLNTPRRGAGLVWGPRIDTTWTLLHGRLLALELAVAGLYATNIVSFRTTDGARLHHTGHWVVQASLGVGFHFH